MSPNLINNVEMISINDTIEIVAGIKSMTCSINTNNTNTVGIRLADLWLSKSSHALQTIA